MNKIDINQIKLCIPRTDDIYGAQKLISYFSFCHRDHLIDLSIKKRIIIAKDNEKVVGVIIYNAKKNGILDLLVDKKYKRMGIGKMILKKSMLILSLKRLRILAYDKDFNNKKDSSVPFWLKMGFKKTGRIKTTKHAQLCEMTYGNINFLTFKI